jgi:hypothetical protein
MAAENTDEGAQALYLTGFGESDPLEKLSLPDHHTLAVAPILVRSGHTKYELLFISHRSLSEAEWLRLSAPLAASTTHQLIHDTAQGRACVDALLRKAPTRVALWDAYRLLSDGCMHECDTRDWLMTHRALHRLQAEVHAKERARTAVDTHRLEVARLIECNEQVIHTAHAIWCATAAEEEEDEPPSLAFHRTQIIARQRMELHALEARYIDLLAELDTLDDGLRVCRQLLLRQQAYQARRHSRRLVGHSYYHPFLPAEPSPPLKNKSGPRMEGV